MADVDGQRRIPLVVDALVPVDDEENGDNRDDEESYEDSEDPA